MVLELQKFSQALASVAIEQEKIKEKFEDKLVEIRARAEAIIKEYK